jgi:cell division protein FtsB
MAVLVSGEQVHKVQTSHDIGLLTAAKLVGICWAGLMPIVFPAWLIIKGEIRQENHIQDVEIAANYVTRAEYNDLKEVIRELRDEVHKLRDTIIFNGPQNGKK